MSREGAMRRFATCQNIRPTFIELVYSTACRAGSGDTHCGSRIVQRCADSDHYSVRRDLADPIRGDQDRRHGTSGAERYNTPETCQFRFQVALLFPEWCVVFVSIGRTSIRCSEASYPFAWVTALTPSPSRFPSIAPCPAALVHSKKRPSLAVNGDPTGSTAECALEDWSKFYKDAA
jgi:hypothetical protein